MTAFVDTSALIAFLDAEDPAHGTCREAWRHAALEGEGLVTTDYVVLEAVAVAQRRWGLNAVRTLVGEYLPLIEVDPVSKEDRDAGLAALLAAGRRRLSLGAASRDMAAALAPLLVILQMVGLPTFVALLCCIVVGAVAYAVAWRFLEKGYVSNMWHQLIGSRKSHA